MRKIFLVIIFISFIICKVKAQNKTFSLTIKIEGFNSNKGNVLIALYNKKEQFLKNHFKHGILKITNKITSYTIEEVPEGEYAISVFHDENSNNKMDTGFLGMPKENYGFSNNVRGFMGPPRFEKAKFTLLTDKEITILIN